MPEIGTVTDRSGGGEPEEVRAGPKAPSSGSTLLRATGSSSSKMALTCLSITRLYRTADIAPWRMAKRSNLKSSTVPKVFKPRT